MSRSIPHHFPHNDAQQLNNRHIHHNTQHCYISKIVYGIARLF